jgi:hypothetical protein
MNLADLNISSTGSDRQVLRTLDYRQSPNKTNGAEREREGEGHTGGSVVAGHAGEDPRRYRGLREPPPGPLPVGRSAVHPAARRPPRGPASAAARVLRRRLRCRGGCRRGLPPPPVHHSLPFSGAASRSLWFGAVCGGWGKSIGATAGLLLLSQLFVFIYFCRKMELGNGCPC